MSGRHAAALVLGLFCAGLVFSCAQTCTTADHAKIAADWFTGVRARCKGAHSLAECPEAEKLKAERAEAERAAECR